MVSARRIMQQMLEVMLLMVAESSWRVVEKEQVLLSLVLHVAATGTSTREWWKLKLCVSVPHLPPLAHDSFLYIHLNNYATIPLL